MNTINNNSNETAVERTRVLEIGKICCESRHQSELPATGGKSPRVYNPGFGFHVLRREAVTELAAILGANAAQRLAGHSRADMTLYYTLADQVKQDAAIRTLQERIIGKTEEKVN